METLNKVDSAAVKLIANNNKDALQSVLLQNLQQPIENLEAAKDDALIAKNSLLISLLADIDPKQAIDTFIIAQPKMLLNFDAYVKLMKIGYNKDLELTPEQQDALRTVGYVSKGALSLKLSSCLKEFSDNKDLSVVDDFIKVYTENQSLKKPYLDLSGSGDFGGLFFALKSGKISQEDKNIIAEKLAKALLLLNDQGAIQESRNVNKEMMLNYNIQRSNKSYDSEDENEKMRRKYMDSNSIETETAKKIVGILNKDEELKVVENKSTKRIAILANDVRAFIGFEDRIDEETFNKTYEDYMKNVKSEKLPNDPLDILTRQLIQTAIRATCAPMAWIISVVRDDLRLRK
ncbi:MAG: hypothetical protein LBB11_04440 [Puniceicoccales bacterium]|nr:hypothetical protein [Puniceicoccales bacterium]